MKKKFGLIAMAVVTTLLGVSFFTAFVLVVPLERLLGVTPTCLNGLNRPILGLICSSYFAGVSNILLNRLTFKLITKKGRRELTVFYNTRVKKKFETCFECRQDLVWRNHYCHLDEQSALKALVGFEIKDTFTCLLCKTPQKLCNTCVFMFAEKVAVKIKTNPPPTLTHCYCYECSQGCEL